jgi:hypothetical protein
MSNSYYNKFEVYILPILKEIFNYCYSYWSLLRETLKKNPKIVCNDIPYINSFIIIVLWLFLISSLIWMLYEIFKNIYLYFKLSSYRYFKDGNPKFADSPSFKQLENMFYLNDYLSFDFIFITFFFTAIFVIVKLYIFKSVLNNKEYHYKYVILFCYISIIIAIIYYLLNYIHIINVGKSINAINRLFYMNINTEFINTKKICNYLDKKNEFDNKFVYGKCNDLKANISINRLYEYIKSIFDDINQNHMPSNNINITKFRTLTDKNGILYKDKIVSAFFTYQMLKYFVDNDLLEEAKDFFSAFNMIYTPNIQIIKKKINPILYLKLNNFMLFESIYQFEGDMKISFYENKNLFEFIKLEYNKIQNQIQKLVVDVYDICNTKLTSIYFYYFILFIVIIILISIYKISPNLLPDF